MTSSPEKSSDLVMADRIKFFSCLEFPNDEIFYGF